MSEATLEAYLEWLVEMQKRIRDGSYETDAAFAREFDLTRGLVSHYRRNVLGIRRSSWGGAHNLTGNGTSTRIPTVVGVPELKYEFRWSEGELKQFMIFFTKREYPERAKLIRAAKAGDAEAAQKLLETFRLRMVLVEEYEKSKS